MAASLQPVGVAAVSSGLVSPSGEFRSTSPGAAAALVVEPCAAFYFSLTKQSRPEAAARNELRTCLLHLVAVAPTPISKRLLAQVLAFSQSTSVLEAFAVPAVLDRILRHQRNPTCHPETLAAQEQPLLSSSTLNTPGWRRCECIYWSSSRGVRGNVERPHSAWAAASTPRAARSPAPPLHRVPAP